MGSSVIGDGRKDDGMLPHWVAAQAVMLPYSPAAELSFDKLFAFQSMAEKAGFYSLSRVGIKDTIQADHAWHLMQPEGAEYAESHLKEALSKDNLTHVDWRLIQASLNRIAAENGGAQIKVDGDPRQQTMTRLAEYLGQKPELYANLSDAVQRQGLKYLQGETLANFQSKGEAGLVDRFQAAMSNLYDRGAKAISGLTATFKSASLNPTPEPGSGLLNTQLIKRMDNDPEVRRLVAATFDAAERNGLDGAMLANQFWQESRYNPDAVSPAGARGIAQFMPMTGVQYGLESANEMHDPIASINAGAAFMRDLTQRYGDQKLALIAYNGGGRAIEFVERKLGVDNVTAGQWMDYMSDRQAALGTTGRESAWDVETLGYVQTIATPAVA